MDLKQFNALALKWCQQFDNVKLSGVAKIGDQNELLWSMSIAVLGESQLPPVDRNNLSTMKSIVEQRPIDSLVLFKIQSVQFIMGPEMSSNQWQIQFLCED